MASFHIQIQHPLLHKSQFLGQISFSTSTPKSLLSLPKPSSHRLLPIANFNLYEILGGRGLCNGEDLLQQELKKTPSQQQPTSAAPQSPPSESSETSSTAAGDFEKELMGLTGGFPGGERGLQRFIAENPPPRKKVGGESSLESGFDRTSVKKPQPPELPLLLPGMIAIVKNPSNPFYMYCGIVQRITDGKAGVLFEGGNWDRLVTFRLEELERREKGPPMVSPKSAILEDLVQKT